MANPIHAFHNHRYRTHFCGQNSIDTQNSYSYTHHREKGNSTKPYEITTTNVRISGKVIWYAREMER